MPSYVMSPEYEALCKTAEDRGWVVELGMVAPKARLSQPSFALRVTHDGERITADGTGAPKTIIPGLAVAALQAATQSGWLS